ncbi:hypothetical protein JTB14_015299 [Gonioctena quinquepunctata]|nr:hypothetical protein JTB14_015299 [Gonioctena quinquepunctata]
MQSILSDFTSINEALGSESSEPKTESSICASHFEQDIVNNSPSNSQIVSDPNFETQSKTSSFASNICNSSFIDNHRLAKPISDCIEAQTGPSTESVLSETEFDYIFSSDSDSDIEESNNEHGKTDNKNKTDPVLVENTNSSFLRGWALRNNLTHKSVTELLQWFSTNPDISNLPKDARTLLQTPRHVNTIQMEMMERLLRDMQTIKLDVRSLVLELNNNKFTQYQQLDAQLRFKDYEELQKFNESLLEDYFNKMQATISLLGGRDLNDTTRKMLSLLVSHELSLNIYWIGANEKGSFQKLVNVLKLTYGAVRRNQATANATNSEIDNAIRNWLKNAPDRAGGRANRKNKKFVAENIMDFKSKIQNQWFKFLERNNGNNSGYVRKRCKSATDLRLPVEIPPRGPSKQTKELKIPNWDYKSHFHRLNEKHNYLLETYNNLKLKTAGKLSVILSCMAYSAWSKSAGDV